MKITFIKSPTGAFKLAYNVGDTVEMEESKARELMELNFAIPAKTNPTQPKQTATAKPKKKEIRKK